MTLLAIIQDPAISLDTSSAVSIGVLLIVLGASWRLSSLLARIDEKLKNALERLNVLSTLPERMTSMESQMRHMEDDINELWAAYRGDPPENARHAPRRRSDQP